MNKKEIIRLIIMTIIMVILIVCIFILSFKMKSYHLLVDKSQSCEIRYESLETEYNEILTNLGDNCYN